MFCVNVVGKDRIFADLLQPSHQKSLPLEHLFVILLPKPCTILENICKENKELKNIKY